MKVGIIGAGNVIWAYFQVLDRLLPRGLARWGRCAPDAGKIGQTFKNFVRKSNWLRIQSRCCVGM